MTLARLLVLLSTACLCCVGFVATNPIAFQKSVSIVEVDEIRELRRDPEPLDLAQVIGDIPYAANRSNVYSVCPATRFQKTIIQGNGNCSNMSFGLAFELDRRGIDYQIVLVIPQRTFLQGRGHTVLNMWYQHQGESKVGVVDLLAGGIPCRAGRPVHVRDLEGPPMDDVSIIQLAALDIDNAVEYYKSGLIDKTIGYIDANDLSSYFQFINSIYVPLGNEKLERYVFDGLALLLGRYPPIQVRSVSETFDGCLPQRYCYLGILWFFRTVIVATPLLIGFRILRFAAARTRSRIRANPGGRAI